MQDRSATAIFLVYHGCTWDAEIILRAFYEAAANILFICYSSASTKESLAIEFWLKLRDIDERKNALKAEFAKSIFNSKHAAKPIFEALQDENIFNVNTTSAKNDRKKLEQKWSFAGIIDQLDKLSEDGAPLVGVKALLHTYGMSSHLIHADQAALGLMHDRARRDPAERLLLEAAHAARVLSDQVSISFFCLDALRKQLDHSGNISEELFSQVRQFLDLANRISEPFYESQTDFYSKYSSK